MILVALALLLQTGTVVLDNEYVRVTRNAAPCAAPNVPGCADRVIVALGETELVAAGVRRTMVRGDIAVFKPGEAYEPPAGGPFFEVAIKPNHPPVRSLAALATAFRPAEPDHGRELRPVDGVEEAVLGPDRHSGALCHPS